MNLSRGKCIFNEFFIYFYNVEYKMDIFSFLRRKKMKQADLARSLETVPGNVTRWVKGEGVPSYELCAKLLSLGMTVKELFGIDYVEGDDYIPSVPPEFLKSPEFMEGVRYQLAEGIKENGLVKEEQVKYVVRQELEKLLPELKKADKI